MKRVLCSFLAGALLLGASVMARDLTTVSGDVYKNISVRTKDATGIQIMHDDGVAFIDFKNLSEADQKDFGFDLATYAEGWKQKFEAERLRREQAELATLQAIARTQAQIAQNAAAMAQGTWQAPLPPLGQTALQVTTDVPNVYYGGYPLWIPPYYSGVRNWNGSSTSSGFSGFSGFSGGGFSGGFHHR